MDAKSVDRQFWLRFMLVIGMLLGTMPMIDLPLIVPHWTGSAFGLFATIFSAATVLPACAMAFWRRRIACVWLTINGVILIAAEAVAAPRPHGVGTGELVSVAVPILIACVLSYTEIRRWPGALER